MTLKVFKYVKKDVKNMSKKKLKYFCNDIFDAPKINNNKN